MWIHRVDPQGGGPMLRLAAEQLVANFTRALAAHGPATLDGPRRALSATPTRSTGAAVMMSADRRREQLLAPFAREFDVFDDALSAAERQGGASERITLLRERALLWRRLGAALVELGDDLGCLLAARRDSVAADRLARGEFPE